LGSLSGFGYLFVDAHGLAILVEGFFGQDAFVALNLLLHPLDEKIDFCLPSLQRPSLDLHMKWRGVGKTTASVRPTLEATNCYPCLSMKNTPVQDSDITF